LILTIIILQLTEIRHFEKNKLKNSKTNQLEEFHQTMDLDMEVEKNIIP